MQNKRKIGKWEYPYKVWPEDFPYGGIFSEAFIAKQIAANRFPDTEDFKRIFVVALENAARLYYGECYFRGKMALSDKDIERETAKLSELAHLLKERLETLPLELFEELVEATEERECEEGDPYELEDTSHYRQSRLNEIVGLPFPPIEAFYKNHEGYSKFCALKERLQQDLQALSTICDKAPHDSEWHFERHKKMGPQRKALEDFVYKLTLFWEYFSDKKATRYKRDNGTIQSTCLDFLDELFAVITYHYKTSVDPDYTILGRTQLDTALASYIKAKSGWRTHNGNREVLRNELCGELFFHSYFGILEKI